MASGCKTGDFTNPHVLLKASMPYCLQTYGDIAGIPTQRLMKTLQAYPLKDL